MSIIVGVILGGDGKNGFPFRSVPAYRGVCGTDGI